MNPELGKLLVQLEYYSNLPKGKIPNLTHRTYDDPDSYVDKFKRTFITYNENREKTIKDIGLLTENTFTAIHKERRTQYYHVILNYLEGFRTGVENIPYGYPNDPDVRAKIKVILTNIDLQLEANGRRTPNQIIKMEHLTNKNNRAIDIINSDRSPSFCNENNLLQPHSYPGVIYNPSSDNIRYRYNSINSFKTVDNKNIDNNNTNNNNTNNNNTNNKNDQTDNNDNTNLKDTHTKNKYKNLKSDHTE
jgi:hypothetical protein